MQRIKKSPDLPPFTFEYGVIISVLLLSVMIIMLAGQNKHTSSIPAEIPHQVGNAQHRHGAATHPVAPPHSVPKHSHPVAPPHTAPKHSQPASPPHAAPAPVPAPPAPVPAPPAPAPVVPLSYVALARQDAVAAGINPDLFERQIEEESGFNPDVVSPAGAIGIAQFMPGTAAEEGINPYDPVQSLNAAASFMANLSSRYGGDYAKALAAYNAGPGNVDYAISMGGSNWFAYLPAETQSYLNVILY